MYFLRLLFSISSALSNAFSAIYDRHCVTRNKRTKKPSRQIDRHRPADSPMDIHTYIQADRQAGSPIDLSTDRQTGQQVVRLTDQPKDRHRPTISLCVCLFYSVCSSVHVQRIHVCTQLLHYNLPIPGTCFGFSTCVFLDVVFSSDTSYSTVKSLKQCIF